MKKFITLTPGGCQGGASECIKTAEILTPGGLQGVALIPESLIAQWVVKVMKKFITFHKSS